MNRFISIASLFLLTLLSSGCFNSRLNVTQDPDSLLTAHSNDRTDIQLRVTQDMDSLLTVHINDQTDLQFRKIPNQDFWMSVTEVSIAQMEPAGRWPNAEYVYLGDEPGYQETWPAMNVMPQEILNFCSWLNKRVTHDVIPKGYSVRLPTVEEWETAAKCGTDREYPWGNEWPPAKFTDGRYPNLMGEDRFPKSGAEFKFRYGNMYYGYPDGEENQILGYRDGFPGPCPVEQAGMNEWGIVGLAGNVEEWCWDRGKQDYVLKGGWWTSCFPGELKISRIHELPEKPWPFDSRVRDRRSHWGSGFRVVLAPEMKQK
ncbi:MAG TPA: SUMF1/EgtB/PvdO family nonheme iron enzyme [Candidatus Sumerlaeota bacterium]|nr:SUMF1/EgtB/PvdO family nonheme iron enzyme [Candidatus Sumerlaeota bacterium]